MHRVEIGLKFLFVLLSLVFVGLNVAFHSFALGCDFLLLLIQLVQVFEPILKPSVKSVFEKVGFIMHRNSVVAAEGREAMEENPRLFRKVRDVFAVVDRNSAIF